MSTGYECEFYEWEYGKWYYLMQRWDCPVGAWDWREWADCFGPYNTYEQAIAAMRRDNANPGGWTALSYKAAVLAGVQEDKLMQKLVAGAEKERWPACRGWKTIRII